MHIPPSHRSQSQEINRFPPALTGSVIEPGRRDRRCPDFRPLQTVSIAGADAILDDFKPVRMASEKLSHLIDVERVGVLRSLHQGPMQVPRRHKPLGVSRQNRGLRLVAQQITDSPQ